MRALRHAGLIDADPEVERLRNIVASPLDDIDPEAAFDLGPSVAALETRLRAGRGPAAVCRPSSASSSTRKGACRSATSTRTSASRRPRGGDVRGLSRRRRRARRAMRARRDGRRRGAAWPRFPRACRRRRSGAAADARAGRARRARRPSSRRPACEAKPRARSQRRASLRDVLGAHAFGAAVVVGAAAAFGEIEAGRFKALIERARTLGASGLQAHPLAGLPDRWPRRARRARSLVVRSPSSDLSSTRTTRGCASPLVPARRPACMAIDACATTRRAGRRCCPRARASFSMSAAAPRDAPGRLRRRRL